MRPTDPTQLRDDLRQRIAKLLGLLGSQHDAEALSAGRKADALRRAHGFTWHDLVAGPALPPPQPKPRRPRPSHTDLLAHWPEQWHPAVLYCLRSGVTFNDWTADFLSALSNYTHRPSDRQLQVLYAIVERVLTEGAP